MLNLISAIFEFAVGLLLLGAVGLAIIFAIVCACFMIGHKYADSDKWLKDDRKGRLD